MILLNWERTEGKKTTPQQQNWQKETESSKIPNSAKGDQQCWFSQEDSLLMSQEFRGVRCFQINILRVIPVEQDTLNEAFCAGSGRRGKFADFRVLGLWPPLQQPQKPCGNYKENKFPSHKSLVSLLSLLEMALFPDFSLSEAMQQHSFGAQRGKIIKSPSRTSCIKCIYYKYFAFCTVQNAQAPEENVSQMKTEKCVTIAHLNSPSSPSWINKAPRSD